MQRLVENAEECRGVLEAHHPEPLDLLAAGIEEDDAGWPEEAETLQQGLVLLPVVGDVGLEQGKALDRKSVV